MPEARGWTEEEENALRQFKERLKDVQIENMDLLEDRRLINWLRARDLKLDDAEIMLRKSLEWRKEAGIDSILTKHSIPIENPILENLPTDIVGWDKEGNSILAVYSGTSDLKALVQLCGKEVSMQVIYYLLETAYAHVIEHSTDPYKLNKTVYIVDLEGLKYKDVMTHDVLELLINSLKAVEANYPEMLYKAYILNAPFLFSALWNILKQFVSSNTQAKINIIGQSQDKIASSLLDIIHCSQLPLKWGGRGYSHRIPELNVASFHIKSDDCEKDLVETVIPAGDVVELPFEVETPKAILRNLILWNSWGFKTKQYDIGFSLIYRPFPAVGTDKSIKNELDEKEKVGYKRINTQKGFQSGAIVCDVPGNYSIRFDNTYSRMRQKTVLYHADLMQITTNGNVYEDRIINKLSFNKSQ